MSYILQVTVIVDDAVKVPDVLDDVARRLREHPLAPGRMRHESIAGGPIDSTVELRAAEDGA